VNTIQQNNFSFLRFYLKNLDSMSRNGSFYQDDSECVVYVKFPVQNSELDEQVVKHLFSQVGRFILT
jgi:hypothetical protein